MKPLLYQFHKPTAKTVKLLAFDETMDAAYVVFSDEERKAVKLSDLTEDIHEGLTAWAKKKAGKEVVEK
jgi:hypothetical protein